MVFKKGKIPWNKGTKGLQVAWNKGIPQSPEAKKKNSDAHIGKIASEKTKSKMSNSHLGKHWKWSEESKIKASKSRKELFKLHPEKFTRGEKLSKAQLKRYEDPTEHEKLSKIHKIVQNKPEVKENNRQAQLKRFQNPLEIEKHSKGQLKRFQNHLEVEKMCQSQLKRYQDPLEREKLRKARIKLIKQNYGICYPTYNKTACEFFKKFDEQNNTKGRYAVYGDGEYELQNGYFVDYINFDLKLIMEYDEEHHYDKNGNLRHKDIIRQKEIQELYPDFKFIRIKEKELYEVKNV